MVYFIRVSLRTLLLAVVSSLTVAIISPSLCPGESRYVGSASCKDCHPEEYKNFMTYAKKSKSFNSIQTMKKGLTEREIEGCYSCHTTGYGKRGGFESPEKTPHLQDAGCEVCHGPASVHIKSMSRQDIKTRIQIEDCEVCHTAVRVKSFNYKPMVHGGAH